MIINILPTLSHKYTGEYGIHGGDFPTLIVLMYLEEVDGVLEGSSEAAAIYGLLEGEKKGRKILHFVENNRARFKASGVQLFQPVYT